MAESSGVVVFGGYRGDGDRNDSPLASLETTFGSHARTHGNHWAGPGESLLDRLQRAVDWLGTEAEDVTELNVFACSMGCQVAARFLVHLTATLPSISVGQVLLVAPDPKYRRLQKDEEEAAAGGRSAYDEAVELWGGGGPPGPEFVNALKGLSTTATVARIVYARGDGVAEWDANVKLMMIELGPVHGVDLVEARDGQRVTEHGLVVDLRSVDPPSDVHDRLWGATRFA